ncbi:dTMP kinase [Acetonema longum]|uniref:Thymidylate kinase n=1 Tax=Acetonema longum DSM 6540 TaxID=1009370 RepID=F7NDD0_9FIRM|nr:dTMP kinase [Acetonema longum]EGO65962.1 thymidylate kinase [Acetonema longum DSM 6540]
MQIRGMFITFEGPDGAGKTTQIGLLSQYLSRRGMAVVTTREPGGTPLGDDIRRILLDVKYKGMDPRAETLLYLAARAQHAATVIRPALAEGRIILSDRFADSTLAYQGAARALAAAEVAAANEFATAGLIPDLTILLDGDPAELQTRRQRRGAGDRIEAEAIAFHRRVRTGFLQLAGKEPDRFRIINALDSVETINSQIVCYIDEFLHRREKQ